MRPQRGAPHNLTDSKPPDCLCCFDAIAARDACGYWSWHRELHQDCVARVFDEHAFPTCPTRRRACPRGACRDEFRARWGKAGFQFGWMDSRTHRPPTRHTPLIHTERECAHGHVPRSTHSARDVCFGDAPITFAYNFLRLVIVYVFRVLNIVIIIVS